jgi:hypothetical protein
VKLFDQFLKAEHKLFAYFGYHPAKNGYAERHPIVDLRDHEWMLVNDGHQLIVCHSNEPLSGLKLEVGRGIIAEEVLDWLGANRRTGQTGGLWRGPEYTLVATVLPNEGMRRYLVLANANQRRNPILVKMVRAQIGA